MKKIECGDCLDDKGISGFSCGCPCHYGRELKEEIKRYFSKQENQSKEPEPNIRQWLCANCGMFYETRDGQMPKECERCEDDRFREKSIKGN